MFPATSVLVSAARTIAPTISVTVLLPFDPVMPMTLVPGNSSRTRANSSMSPITSTPRASAACTGGSASGTPGLIAIELRIGETFGPKCPGVQFDPGSSARSCSAFGGAARLSATRTRAPRPASQRAIDIPLEPRPSTSTRLFSSSSGTRLLHRSLDSGQAHGADVLGLFRMQLASGSCFGRTGGLARISRMNNSNCRRLVICYLVM